MPMQFAYRALFQMLLSCCDVFTGRQVCHHLGSYPTPVQQSRFRVGKAPLEIDDDSIVRALRAEVIGILEIELFVGTTLILC